MRCNLFHGGAIHAVMVWSFLGQVLRDGKEASCQAAVSCVVAYGLQREIAIPTADTGDYCRARAKLSEAALRDLTREVAAEVEEQADSTWLWLDLHPKLVDGFTFTMPDTEENQAEYPQAKTQKPGIGFPIARAVAILSLATACVMDLAVGPYAGKETGETALLRQLLGSFESGDVAVMDRFYCSFMMIALLLNQDVQVCARMHQRRHVDFRHRPQVGRRTTLGEVRSHHRVDEAVATDLDGPSNLRHHPRDIGDARDSLQHYRRRTAHSDDYHRHNFNGCREVLERRHRRAVRFSMELGT